jgi:hypothetical protein
MGTRSVTSFRDLRASHLHELDEAAWRAYYPAMAVFLSDADPATRSSAVERLSMAVFSAEESAERQARREGRGWERDQKARFAWFRHEIETAHGRFNDVIPALLKGLSFTGDDWILMPPLRAWLGAMLNSPPPGVLPDKIEAALLRLRSFDEANLEDKAHLIALLDHTSNAVRACAAYQLSGFATDDTALFELIKQKELVRPGLAGPFWTEFHFDSQYWPIDPISWMMDILERRAGPEPALEDMGYNGIDFYLHEVCDGSPETIRRMISGGHIELAVETACEMRCMMPGMEPILIILGHHDNPGVARRARLHLAMYYRVLHPAIADGSIRHDPDWDPEAEMFSVHWGENHALWFVVLYPRHSPDFTNGTAWALIDRALPPDVRGPVVRHMLDWKTDDPPVAYDTQTSRIMQFASGANLTLDGDVKAERWHRIEIGGAKLGDKWTPFASANAPVTRAYGA